MAKYKLVAHNSRPQRQWAHSDDTRKHLTVGEVYKAETEVHGWHTILIINGKRFNSVCFEKVED